MRLLCMWAVLLFTFACASVCAQSVAPTLTIQWPSNSIGRGSITLTVGGYTSTIRYGEFSTAASIAANFGGVISQDKYAPVWVKGYKDGTVRMKARSGTISGTPTICITPDGSSGCQQPGGTSVATGGVDPAGVYLGDAVYGYVIQKTDGSSGYDQAGNITAYTDTVNGQWTAGYDTMNRLTSAYQALSATQLTAGQSIATPWGSAAQQYLCWQYDAWGNRKMQTSSNSPMADWANCVGASSSTSYNNISYDDANGTNHITNNLYEYDGAGNVTADGIYRYQYDSDGRLCAVRKDITGEMTGYLYDAEGQRVSKGSITPPNLNDTASWCNLSTNNFTPVTHDILGINGEKLATLDGNDNWQSTNIYANGELVATYDSSGTHYQFPDWLGTRRKQTDIYGNPQEICMGGAYGEVNCPMLGANPLHFANKERDAESGLDDFGARYYSSSLGRFMSPDWAGKAVGIPYADLTNPQSLNLYSYVRNSPLGGADLDGHSDYYSDGDPYSQNTEFDIEEEKLREHGAEKSSLSSNGQKYPGQDPTLPTEVAPSTSWVERLMNAIFPKTWGDMASLALMFPTEGLSEPLAVMADVASKGRAGEAAAQAIEDLGTKEYFKIEGRSRFTDGSTSTTVNEVKNVAKQGWTRQLKDTATHAKATGRTFQLWVRDSTKLSGPLQNAEKAGHVVIRRMLP